MVFRIAADRPGNEEDEGCELPQKFDLLVGGNDLAEI